jgi:hypothetical protein
MWWWVSLGVAVLGLLVLVAAAVALLARLTALSRAAARAQSRLGDVEVVQMSVAHLQERVAELAKQAAGVQERLDARRGRGSVSKKG